MLRRIRIKIDTLQREVATSLFKGSPFTAEGLNAEAQTLSVTTEGGYYDDGTRVQISYREGELSGLEGTRTTLAFHKNDPKIITLTRDGAVRTTLLFEVGVCHTSLYQTPYMPFEVAVKADEIENRLAECGTLALRYTVEIKGANATETEFKMTILPDKGAPVSK